MSGSLALPNRVWHHSSPVIPQLRLHIRQAGHTKMRRLASSRGKECNSNFAAKFPWDSCKPHADLAACDFQRVARLIKLNIYHASTLQLDYAYNYLQEEPVLCIQLYIARLHRCRRAWSEPGRHMRLSTGQWRARWVRVSETPLTTFAYNN